MTIRRYIWLAQLFKPDIIGQTWLTRTKAAKIRVMTILGELLKAKDCARTLGISERTLFRWRSSLIGPPFFRVEGRIYYNRSDIDQWMYHNKWRK
jgi:predicted DNA-binding transcriptional regulator AlpA